MVIEYTFHYKTNFFDVNYAFCRILQHFCNIFAREIPIYWRILDSEALGREKIIPRQVQSRPIGYFDLHRREGALSLHSLVDFVGFVLVSFPWKACSFWGRFGCHGL